MFSADNTVLLVIDVQGRLAYLMQEKEKLFKHLQALIKAATILDIPILHTEQSPDKIGKTIPEIAEMVPNLKPITKASFSACSEKSFMKELKLLKRKQIIAAGIETHVCVHQTVADLLRLKYEVQVVADAVSSRSMENKSVALDRMRSNGAVLTSTEMITTELIRTSAHPKFKEILGLIR